MDKVFAWVNSLAIVFISTFTTTVDAAAFTLVLALLLVGIEFVTGVAVGKLTTPASPPPSRRLMRSFGKVLVYAGVIVLTLVVGVLLHCIDLASTAEASRTGFLLGTLYCVKIEAWVIAWIEIVSILENLSKVFPRCLMIKFLHFVVAVEFIKRIPKLSEALKARDSSIPSISEFDEPEQKPTTKNTQENGNDNQ